MFDETWLPRIGNFHSNLNLHFFYSDYNDTKKVWNTFETKNIGDYHGLQKQRDVL